MPVPVLFHPACQRHDPGLGHPERPGRIAAALEGLRAPDVAPLVEWCEARLAPRAAVERVHPARYLDGLERLAAQGGGVLDADTVMSADSWDACMAAAGTAIGAVERGLAGWRPDLLLVSAGFDSLAGDPLGGFTLEPEDMARWTTAFRERVAPAPVEGVPEGGYRLDLLPAGARDI